jgi:hypothetical protein
MDRTLAQWYSLPAGRQALETLVNRIEANPGRMIEPAEFDEGRILVDAKAALGALPEGLTEADFVGIVKLALLTECATESYAAVFEGQARRFDAPWLGRFTRNVWAPDELTHHAPFKLLLLQLGFAEADLDRAVRETQQRRYIHACGETPIHLTTFGMVQEYLTDNWYRLIAQLLQRASPPAAAMVLRIKRRETLHTIWYRDMTALQIEANPHLLGHVAEALAAFQMPGNVLVPELQTASFRWLPRMGGDVDRIRRDLVRLLSAVAGDIRRTGALLVEVAAARGERVGPIAARHIRVALDRLGGPGYGLIGEAVLERVGLGYMFRASPEGPDSALRPYTGVYERVRGLLRSWLAEHIELNLDPPPALSAEPALLTAAHGREPHV